MIYLDNAATTLPDPQVIAVITETLSQYPGNPSSLHKLGREANRLLTSCRETILASLGGEGRLVFTSGGTESNNWAIAGALHLMRHRGRHIVSTAIEHDAVLSPLRELADRGYEVTLLQPDAFGQISPDDLARALREDTALVSIMQVNNETGAILPISEMAQIVDAHSNALFHTDAVQAFGKIPVHPSALGVDLLSISAHKLHGPRGIGTLWIRNSVKLPPFLRGGGQENGLRSGTEALHNIAGFAKAVSLSMAELSETTAHLEGLQIYLREKLPASLPFVRFLPQGAPHIVSLSLPGAKSEVLMNALDGQDIYLSHASACKRGGRSHVLSAMGLPADVIDGTLRVSFSRETSLADLDALITALTMACNTLFPRL